MNICTPISPFSGPAWAGKAQRRLARWVFPEPPADSKFLAADAFAAKRTRKCLPERCPCHISISILLFLGVLNGTDVNAQSNHWSANQLPAGCIAWWQADNNMVDSIGAHHGVAESGPQFYSPTYAGGIHGSAWSFNGTNQSVCIPNNFSDLDGWTQFTMEAWVFLTSLPAVPGNGYSVFSKVGNNRGPYSGNYGYQFGFTHNAESLFIQFNVNGQIWPGTVTSVDLQGAVTTGIWTHVATTYDGVAVKLYLNGVPLVTNNVGACTLASTLAALRISMDDNYNVPFPGLIDDARIYNRALSDREIAYLYLGPPPPLSISRNASNGIVISWPSASSGWRLQHSTDLQPASWMDSTDSIDDNGIARSVMVASPVGSRFFRLAKP